MECASQRFLFNIEVLKHEKCNLKKKSIPQPVCAGGQAINHVSAEICVCFQEQGSCFPAVDRLRVMA